MKLIFMLCKNTNDFKLYKIRVPTLLLFGAHVKIEDSVLLLEHSNLTRIIHGKCPERFTKDPRHTISNQCNFLSSQGSISEEQPLHMMHHSSILTRSITGYNRTRFIRRLDEKMHVKSFYYLLNIDPISTQPNQDSNL